MEAIHARRVTICDKDILVVDNECVFDIVQIDMGQIDIVQTDIVQIDIVQIDIVQIDNTHVTMLNLIPFFCRL